MKRIRKSIVLMLCSLMIAGMLSACHSNTGKIFQSPDDFTQAKIGILTGSSFDQLAKEHFPKAEKQYYINMTDLFANLKQERIDGVLMDKAFFTPLAWEDKGLSYVEMDMPATEYAVAFPKSGKSESLKRQINEFIWTHTEDGWLAELEKKWMGESEPDSSLDLSQLTGENGTLRVGTTVESKPFDYLKDGQFCGYDADFIFQFAKEYGYGLEIELMDFGVLMASLAAGQYDLAISSITVTEERKEIVDFSDIYCGNPIVMAILQNETDAENGPKWETLADLETATIGIVTGTNWDMVAQENFPQAQRMYFITTADALLSLDQGKIDAFFADKMVYTGVRWENDAIDSINEPLEMISNALILAKDGYDETLLAQLNAFIDKAKKEGTLDRLEKKWFGDTEPQEHPDYTKLTGENGTLCIAIGDSMKPIAYQRGNLYTGYEAEFLTLFAQEYGYRLDMQGMAFDALIPSVASGKCDIGACGITVTEERKENVTFSNPHLETYGVAIIRNEFHVPSPKKTLADFEHAIIGIHTGSVFDDYAKELFPEAQCQYYNLVSDMILAMSQGKIDGYIGESVYATAALWEGTQIQILEEVIAHTNAGYIFPKGDEAAQLRDQVNDFIRKAQENGLIEELRAKWFGSAEPTDFFDAESLTGEKGTLKVLIVPDLKPLCYVKNGTFVGYEIEFLQLFAKEYGYGLEFVSVTFDALISGIVSGKYDIGLGGVIITEERAQSIDFSESHLTNDVVMMVNAEETSTEQNSFWEEIKESFHKTFVREDRWKLIVEGIGVTMLISVCAAFTGTLLGFGLYMLSRSDRKVLQLLAKGTAKVYSRVIAGTPVVVILMILFYVIFGKIRDMSGVLVAIIGFTLTFGAFVYDHMTVSVGSVDRGQTEAAYALGYTKNKTFFRIIFPQAMRIFLPSYCGQAVELIKATAVVGYIAVNDLTKMGDIIRSNTYEAFFPLIATAVIYFLLTWILSLVLGVLKLRFEPKRRKAEEILKGVKTE